MKTFDQLIAEAASVISELMPWDLADKLDQTTPLLIDVREPDEFNTMHIANAHNIPRGILEAASEPGYDETHPLLSTARDQEVIVICRSGKRSCLAAYTLHQLGFKQVASLKTGLRGWNDFDQLLVNQNNEPVDGDDAEEYLKPKVN
jgi:rhodanese-related sulfurtransferase